LASKYQSGNDVKPPDYRGWDAYLDASWVDWRKEDVRESDLYELARNWCLLSGIAGGRPKKLINLGSRDIFARQADRLQRFAFALDCGSKSTFKQITWADFLDPMIDQSPKWFSDFCRERGLITT
jgi:hypothetical protein